MIVEIISTGTELLLGQIINTNAAYLAAQLNLLGYDVLYQTTVGDNRERMSHVLAAAFDRADIIVTTGGLGPTQGDITKEVSANLIGRPLLLNQDCVNHIRTFFANRNLAMPDSNLRQAMIHEGAVIFFNDRGTAPGVAIETRDKTIIHLPGPPVEMEDMFTKSVASYLINRFGSQGVIISKVLRTLGMSESSLEEQIKDYIKSQYNPTIALLARSGEIHVRLTAKAAKPESAHILLAELEEKIRKRIGNYIFGIDDETLESVTGKQLAAKKLTVALAESCSGGLISSRLTDIAGTSDYLVGSVVCYSNPVKINKVGVPPETLAAYGAVSQETAMAMAEGIKNNLGSDIGVGVTGIAGPGGAVNGKPVGLVYIAIAGNNGIECYKYNFSGQRTMVKMRTANAALNHLRQYIANL